MAAPAGWYVDPQNSQLIRYFDGQNWTEQTRPVPAAPPAPASPSAPQSPTPAPQPGSAGVSYEHPGRQSAAQQPAQSGYGQSGSQPGQQPGQSAQSGYGQSGPQSAQSGYGQPGPQPAQPAQSGYGQPGLQSPAEERPAGTSRGVKMAIAGAAVGVIALFGVGVALSDDTGTGGLSARDLGVPDDFDCDALADQAIALSQDDAPERQLISASGMVEKTNNFGEVRVPEGTSSALVLTCSGGGTWGNGAEADIVLRLTLDSDEELYVEYGEY